MAHLLSPETRRERRSAIETVDCPSQVVLAKWLAEALDHIAVLEARITKAKALGIIGTPEMKAMIPNWEFLSRERRLFAAMAEAMFVALSDG